MLAAHSWSTHARGEPGKATERDWAIARKVVDAVNTLAERRWVSVKDRLPEIDPATPLGKDGYSEYVLVWPYSDLEPEEMVAVYCKSRQQFETPPWGKRSMEVTHWMPLPAGPEDTDQA